MTTTITDGYRDNIVMKAERQSLGMKSLKTNVLVLLALLPLGLSISACKDGGPGSCEKLFSMLQQCSKGFNITEERFIASCRDKSVDKHTKDTIQVELACSTRSDCSSFEKCVAEEQQKREVARKKSQLGEDIQKLKKEMGANKFRDAAYTCEGLKQDAPNHALVNKLCNTLPKKAIGVLERELKAMRDEGKVEKFFTRCFDLKEFSKRIGPDAVNAAKTLCSEVDASRAAKKALDAATRNLAERKPQIPFDCGYVLKQLEKLDSSWSKEKHTAVARKCYVELGKLVMEMKVPTMKYGCEFNVKKVYDAVIQYKLSDESIAKWIEKARGVCTKR